MKMRRFFGKDMREALNLVTAELGSDAAIMSTQKVPGGIELVAAMDYDESILDRKRRQAEPTTESGAPKEIANPSGHSFQSSSHLSSPSQNTVSNNQGNLRSAQSDITPTLDERRFEAFEKDMAKVIEHQSPQLSQQQELAEKLGQQTAGHWSEDPQLGAMKQEIQMLRDLLEHQLAGLAYQQFDHRSPIQASLARRISKLGLSKSFAESLLKRVKGVSDLEAGWKQVLALLAKEISAAEDQALRNGGILALVGATGVGKTTTLAKIAARYVMQHGAKGLLLLTTDSYRVGAHDQLRTFARILGVPMCVVDSPQDMAAQLRRYQDKHLILVDTAGVSAQDQRLMQQFECLNLPDRRIRKYLVLSATSQKRVLDASVNRFKQFGLDGAIVTKLDETTSLGEVITVISQQNLLLVYTADGQKVPEDLRVAKSHHLISKAVWLAEKFDSSEDKDWVAEQARSLLSA